MFTGIVEETGQISKVNSNSLIIKAATILEDTKVGDSISINGTCLTVTSINNDEFTIDVMPETMRRTNLGGLRYGDSVNLERAISPSSRIGGHFVQGHVDGTGKIISILHEEGAIIVRISAASSVIRYIVDKGFVAVDGVSLTVIDYDDISFSVSLVAHTSQNTTLGRKKQGDLVNIEVDILAKYIEKLGQKDNHEITLDLLEENGFLTTR